MTTSTVWQAMRIAVAALCLLLACGSDAAPAQVESPETNSLRRTPAPAVVPTRPKGFELSVATYNINFGNGHSPRTVETIAALDTDIVMLQETTEMSEAAVRGALSERYPEIRFHHCCRAGGLGVLSRYPILDAEIVETDIGFFPAWWLRVQTPAGPLVIVDVHLRPPISDGGSWVVGFFSTRDARAREIAALWLDVPKGQPIIVAGDFNEEADGGVLKFLSRDGLVSALPEFRKKEPTWHWRVGATTLRMQLDHIAYGGPLQAVGAKVVRGGLSDHEPVVVDFIWPVE